MAYTYEISFDIPADKMDMLQIGSSLERGLGYMRTLMPSEPGFMSARAMYSLIYDDRTHVVFQSMWDEWEDLVNHQNTYLDEMRFLREEFEPHLQLEDMQVAYYEEIP